MSTPIVLVALAGLAALALSGGSAKAAQPGPDEVPDSIVERVIAAIRTDDPGKMRAEAARLRAEGYEAQAKGLEAAAAEVDQRRKTEPGSVGAPRVLARGMKGADVGDWQRQLQRDTYREVNVDDQFGPVTEAATKSWQAERGLAADGKVGPATRAAIGRPAQRPPAPAAPPQVKLPGVTLPPVELPGVTLPGVTLPPVTVTLPASGASAPDTGTRLLRTGSRGADVEGWQLQLRADGFVQVVADGVFGAVTEAATKGWQAQRGLAADGVVGPATRAAIGRAPSPVATPAAPPTPAIAIRPETWRTLRRGANGQDVREWQAFLNLYGAGLDVDGAFGSGTELASKTWQAAQGLSPDAVIGAATRARVQQQLAATVSMVAGPLLDPVRVDVPELVQPLLQLVPADPDAAALARELAAHLRGAQVGHEDKALVRRFQRAARLNDTGQYGPATAEALMGLGVLPPPRPFYWPAKGRSAARARYRLALREQARRHPEHAPALLAAANG